MTHPCHPSLWEADTGRSRAHDHPLLDRKLQSSLPGLRCHLNPSSHRKELLPRPQFGDDLTALLSWGTGIGSECGELIELVWPGSLEWNLPVGSGMGYGDSGDNRGCKLGWEGCTPCTRAQWRPHPTYVSLLPGGRLCQPSPGNSTLLPKGDQLPAEELKSWWRLWGLWGPQSYWRESHVCFPSSPQVP